MHRLTTTTDSIIVTLALGLILLYRRFISPYKNFSCAYRVHTGRASCSAFGEAAIRRTGLVPGIELIRRRLEKCRSAHRKAKATFTTRLARHRHRHSQAGHCDIPVGDCGLSSVDFDPSCLDCSGVAPSPDLCEMAECFDISSCDFGLGDRKEKKNTPPRQHL